MPDVQPSENGVDVDITFRVEERRTGNINFGASVGQGTGLGGFIGLVLLGLLVWRGIEKGAGGQVFLGTVAVFVLVFVLFGAFNTGVEFFPDTDPNLVNITMEAPLE